MICWKRSVLDWRVTKQMEKDLRLEYGLDEEEEMAVKRQAAEKEVELLRRAVEESVTLARVEEDEEGLNRDTLAQNEVQDVDDVDNSDPDEAEEEDDDLGNLHEINSKFRPFRDNISDRMETASVRSYSTTASTIHPDVVKARVKSALEKRGRKGQARRQVVKGEASAKTRSRRNNKDTIASSTSAFWEEGSGKEAGGKGGSKCQDEIQEEQQGHNCIQHICILGRRVRQGGRW